MTMLAGDYTEASQGSLKDTFCNHLKHVAFSTPKCGWNPPLTRPSCNVQVLSCIRIPASPYQREALPKANQAYDELGEDRFGPGPCFGGL